MLNTRWHYEQDLYFERLTHWFLRSVSEKSCISSQELDWAKIMFSDAGYLQSKSRRGSRFQIFVLIPILVSRLSKHNTCYVQFRNSNDPKLDSYSGLETILNLIVSLFWIRLQIFFPEKSNFVGRGGYNWGKILLSHYDSGSDSSTWSFWLIPKLLKPEFWYQVRFRNQTQAESLGVSVPTWENWESLTCKLTSSLKIMFDGQLVNWSQFCSLINVCNLYLQK